MFHLSVSRTRPVTQLCTGVRFKEKVQLANEDIFNDVAVIESITYHIKCIRLNASLHELCFQSQHCLAFSPKHAFSSRKKEWKKKKNLMKSLPSSVEMMEADSEVCRQKVKKQHIT